MQHHVSSLGPVTSGLASNVARDPNCIEMHLKNIEAELAESFNSAENLADKLRGSDPRAKADGVAPAPMDVASRLECILRVVNRINSELGRAHSAISG